MSAGGESRSRPPDDFVAFMRAQRAEFHRMLAHKLALLEGLGAQALGDDAGPQALEEFERGAHSLAGTAGTFGFAEVGLAARELEAAALALRQPAFDTGAVARAFDELRRAIAASSP